MFLMSCFFVIRLHVMFLISWVTALLTFAAILFLYMVVNYRKPDVNWGSSTQAQTYKNALTSVQQLNNVDEHVKNYRPQIMVLCGMPSSRPSLVDFAYLITKQLSLIVCGHIVKANLNIRQRAALREKAYSWLLIQKIKGFYCAVDDMNFEEGAKALLQAYGVGKLRPNILLMGFKENWATCESADREQYFNVLHKALDMHLSICILRVPGGLDFSKTITFGDETLSPSSNQSDLSKSKSISNLSIPRNQSYTKVSHESIDDLTSSAENKFKLGFAKDASKENIFYKSIDGTDVPAEIMTNIKIFQMKHKIGQIDVWWLYDDGGLTLLLPYIINTRRTWSSCKLRVFALANKKNEFDSEQRSMAGLLSKFRIDYSDLKIIPDINRKPLESTKVIFENELQRLKREGDGGDTGVSEIELLSMKDKTNRHLRLRELLLENSKSSTLVVMTLPMPRRNVVSAELYMTWLEVLTKDMPPFLLVRGNQTSVLTFYS